jgi:tRNA threonylcarbamoyladenosine biosynthesis protein TsaE
MKALSHTLPNGWKQSNCVSSLEETFNLAHSLADSLPTQALITLEGDLGAGKTTFVKALVQGLGGDPNEVSSPTFSYLHEYRAGNHTIYHFDLYRFKNTEEFILAGFMENLEEDAICCIEWPEMIAPLLQRPKIALTFRHEEGKKREIIIG